ncbi:MULTISPECIES: IPT/TIG domain-containing protein [unclassified Geodermatophilus]|uniref:IPT/TIG domain-containing protein n=1 Tax=unclassified Geodermatophilus TaxID=2637632 RepID=UPI003EE89ACA
MSDFSRPPLDLLRDSRERGYAGLHVQQGVPILDRDLNLLQDLVVAAVRDLAARYIGNGVSAGSEAFLIEPVQEPQDFRVAAGPDDGPGWCLVDGIEVPIRGPVRYSEQRDAAGRPLPELTTPGPPDADPRVDVVYLDAWVDEVEGTPDLDNSADVGMPTSTRLVVRSLVRVAEGGEPPADAGGHVFYRLARLQRPHGRNVVDAAMIEDLRQRRLTLADLERRLTVVERVLLVPRFVPPPGQLLPTTTPTHANDAVRLKGTNFKVGKLEVLIGGVLAKQLSDPGEDEAVAEVPFGLTPEGRETLVKVTVRNEGGGTTSDEDLKITPKLALVPDRDEQFTPESGPPGTDVTISGYDFSIGQLTVTFATTRATVVGTPTNTTVVARVPDGLAPGRRRITLSIAGQQNVSTAKEFEVAAFPVPRFDAGPFSVPAGSAGTQVTLRGVNFDVLPVKVFFADARADIVGTPTNTRIVTKVPPDLVPTGAQDRQVQVSVNTPGGTAVSATLFTVRR